MNTPKVNKNALVLLGAAELCCRSLRAQGFHADYMLLSHNADKYRHACVVAVAHSRLAVRRFVRGSRIDRAYAKRRIAAWLWIFEDVTLYTICPEALQGTFSADRATEALHALASGMTELVPHYASREAAEASQKLLRQQLAFVEPMLGATPRTETRDARELN